MKDHIVVGHDGSRGGTDALALAVTLADAWATGTAITVVGVYPYDPGYHSASETFEAKLRKQTEDALAPARAEYGDRPGLSFTVVRGSSPAQALHDMARDVDARAIVVGRSHTGALGRAFLGSATEQTLHGSSCAVAVAPVEFAEKRQPLRTIGVAYDGARDARNAVDVAAELARQTGAKLQIIRVIQAIPLWYGGAAEPFPIDAVKESAEADLAEVREQLKDVEVDGQIVLGEPANALGQAAGIDLLVVGSRGFGPVQRVVLGSTSTQLARHAELPLLIVPRVADAPA